MKDKIKNAPFTDDEIRILNLWQQNEFLHPYICCEGEPMIVEKEGLRCSICGTQQFWVHEYSLNEKAAKYNPYNNFKEESID